MTPHSFAQAPPSPSHMSRLAKRRVPPEKRQRTEMSCDYCKIKRRKCSRSGFDSGSCRACLELGQSCQTTQPRKQRLYAGGGQPQSANDSVTTISRAPNVYPEGYTDISANASILLRPQSTAAEFLFEDPLGLPRYIGPTGSFTLLMRLREMMAVQSTPEMGRLVYAQTMGPSKQIQGSERESPFLPPRSVADALIEVFFSKVNCDYPVFHRAMFDVKYEMMWTGNPDLEPSWLLTLYMIFTLGLTAASKKSLSADMQSQKENLKEQCLYRVKMLLPDVLFGATLAHVQALMLYCLYLQISRERNACWNIAGSAIRIAVAIGLHRNSANVQCTMLERVLRKRVWWTLYFFERIESSSLGRPSAIDDSDCNVETPTDGLLDMGDSLPLGFIDSQAILLKTLGQICKEQSNLDHLTGKHADLATKITAKLDQWHRNLPLHLHLEAQCPPTHRRPILLLHIQYHYAVTILTRPYLIARASLKGRSTPSSAQIDFYARKSIVAALASVDLLQRLFLAGVFNAKTWWDVFFIESTAMILALGKMTDDEDLFKDLGNIVESLKICLNILEQCGELSPTMQRFATVTTEFAQALVFPPSKERPKEMPPSERPTSTYEVPVETTPDQLAGLPEDDAFDLDLSNMDPFDTSDIYDVWMNILQDQDDPMEQQVSMSWGDDSTI